VSLCCLIVIEFDKNFAKHSMFLGDNMLVLSLSCSRIGACDNEPYSDMEVVLSIAQNTLLLSIAQFFLSSDIWKWCLIL
jgi:hypothetical protein